MNLTYKIIGEGYEIYNNGVRWIVQDKYIPYKKDTLEESAQAHIEHILKVNSITE